MDFPKSATEALIALRKWRCTGKFHLLSAERSDHKSEQQSAAVLQWHLEVPQTSAEKLMIHTL